MDEDEAEQLECLWEVVREGDRSAIEALIVGDEEHPPLGVSVDGVYDVEGRGILHCLTIEGHNSVAQWLVAEVGAAVDARDTVYGQTALHFAATKDRGAFASMLMSLNADPMARDAAGWTPLHAAARAGSLEVAAALLASPQLEDDAVNARGAAGQTPLHRAAFWGHTDVCTLLLEHGAKISAVDTSGRQPIDVACDGNRRGQLPAIQKLLTQQLPA